MELHPGDLFRRIFPEHKQQLDLRFDGEITPVDIAQPSSDYIKELCGKYAGNNSRLKILSMGTYSFGKLTGENEILEKLIIMLLGKEQFEKIDQNFASGTIGEKTMSEIEFEKHNLLRKENVQELLDDYGMHYRMYLMTQSAPPKVRQETKFFDSSLGTLEGSYDTLRKFLIHIGQGIPSDSIQVKSEKDFLSHEVLRKIREISKSKHSEYMKLLRESKRRIRESKK